MKKKILVMAMSANMSCYLSEEEVIKQTWGKDIVDGLYDNIELLFYRGTRERNFKEDKNLNLLYVPADDSLSGTYDKTVKALKYVEEHRDYDFIVRTNTSTYINLDLLDSLIQGLSDDDSNYYGATYIINGSSRNHLYFRGCFLMFSRKVCMDIIEASEGQRTRNADDAWIGYTLLNLYNRKKIDYYSRLKEVNGMFVIEKHPVVKYSYDTFKDKVWFRLKNGNPGMDRGLIKDKMRSIHAWIKTESKPFEPQTVFNKDSKVETTRGLISLEDGIIISKKNK